MLGMAWPVSRTRRADWITQMVIPDLNLVFMINLLCCFHLYSSAPEAALVIPSHRRVWVSHLAIVLWSSHLPNRLTQLRLQYPPEEFQQDLKADLCHGRVVPSLAQLIPDECMLRPRKLVKARRDTCVSKALTDEVSASGRHVSVFHAEDHGDFAVGEGGEEVDCMGGGG